MKRVTFFLLALAVLALSAYAASVPPLLPRSVAPSDRLPVINTGTSSAYTVSPDQLSSYVQGQISTASASKKGLVKGGGVGIAIRGDGTIDATGAALAEGVIAFENLSTAIKGRYQWLGADAAGSAAAAVTGHESLYDHDNLPTAMQRSALLGSYGTPGSSNRYLTDADPRNADARVPKLHASTHGSAGTDPVIISSSQVTGLDAALAGKQATLGNAATLGKIGEIGGMPIWNGGAWPGGAGQSGGDMFKATYDPFSHMSDAFSRVNHTGTQPANTVTGLAASATTDTTTTANIADSANKRFVTDAQRTVLASTSGTNTGDETQATIKAKLGAATDGVDGYLTAADHLKITNAQPAATAITTANIGAQTANLTQDTMHRWTSDAEKAAWNAKQNALSAGVDYLAPNGSAASLTGFPTLNQSTTGNAATATKLATARTINGVSFDGTANITVPSGLTAGVDYLTPTGSAASLTGFPTLNQSTTGNAATATKLATARTINGVSFDGTANITVADGTKAPLDNPTFTTGITAPVFTSNAADHMVECSNAGDFDTTGLTTSNAGRFCFNRGTSKFRYWTGSAVADMGGSGTWGSITGTLSSQSDLNTALGLKAPLASPALTGTPTAPTASAATNNTQIATTAFVQTAVSSLGSGTIGGSTGSTDNAVLVASGTGGATLKASSASVDPTTGGITIAKQNSVVDVSLLYNDSGTQTTGSGRMGPSGSMAKSYYLRDPNTIPSANQVLVTGTPGDASVKGATASVIQMTAIALSSGPFTPTATAGANTSAVTGLASHYLRVDSEVTVSGSITATYSGTADTLYVDFPIPSNVTATTDCAGAGAAGITGRAINIACDVSGKRALLSWDSSGLAGSGTITYTYTYTVK